MTNKNFSFFAILLLTFSIAFGAFLRIHDLGTESLWLDEGFSVGIAQRPAGAIIEWSKTDVHPPLYLLMLHFWVGWFGKSEFALRMLSALFGITGIIFIYLVGKRIFGRIIGAIGSFLLAVSLMHIQYSQEARSYTILVCFSLISIYFFQSILQHNRFRDWSAYLVSAVVLLYIHSYAVFIIVFENLFFIYHLFQNIGIRRRRPFLLKWVACQALLVVSFLPWILVLQQQLTRRTGGMLEANMISAPDILSLKMTLIQFSGSGTLALLFIILFMIGALFFLFQRKNLSSERSAEQTDGLIFNVLWLFCGILIPFLISILISPIYISRLTMIALPAFYFLVAWAVTQIRLPFRRIVFMLLVLAFSISPLWRYYKFVSKEQWREAAGFLKQHEQTGDVLILCAPWTIETFNYYYDGKLKSNVYPANNSSDLSESIMGQHRIWLFQAYDRVTDPEQSIEQALLQSSTLSLQKRFLGDRETNPEAPPVPPLKLSCFVSLTSAMQAADST
ncbi:glycosyltransferase family 39 protein [candidate division KSB1 bacterium]|nr:glycosyltransferase family 39 protein [candidate division KSB1 bacterium]